MPGRLPQKYRALCAAEISLASTTTGLDCSTAMRQSQLIPISYSTYLQEPTDGLFVVGSHGNYVFVQPEKWPFIFRRRHTVSKDAKELEKQLSSAV